MPARRKSRQRALQVLYMWEVREMPIEEAVEEFRRWLFHAEREEETGEEISLPPDPDPFMEELATGTARDVQSLDQRIAAHAENWRLERMPRVDRCLLRMAIFEMGTVGTPPPIVIDEALELARRYTSPEAIPFLNGVLDAVRRSLSIEEDRAGKE